MIARDLNTDTEQFIMVFVELTNIISRTNALHRGASAQEWVISSYLIVKCVLH